jgi:hypothetical protein
VSLRSSKESDNVCIIPAGWMRRSIASARCARSTPRHSNLVSEKDTHLFLLFFDPVDLNTPTYSFEGYLENKGSALDMLMVVER